MNQRQFVRNIGRIPRLQLHIKRCKALGHDDRVKGFQLELERRKLEMKLADMQEQGMLDPEGNYPEGYEVKNYAEVLKTLLKIKLEAHANEDSVKLKAMVETASVGMPTGAAELTPPAAGSTIN